MMASDLIEGKSTENNLLARLAKIEDRLTQLEKNQRQPLSPNTYTVTNGSVDRAYDANTVAIAELADIVYCILLDLETKGIVNVT